MSKSKKNTKTGVTTMTDQEKIQKIADEASAKILENADVQKITTVEEVRGFIIDELTNNMKDIVYEVSEYAEKEFKDDYGEDCYDVLDSVEITLEQLVNGSLDWPLLKSFASDHRERGTEFVPEDIRYAVNNAIIAGWLQSYLIAAEEAFKASQEVV